MLLAIYFSLKFLPPINILFRVKLKIEANRVMERKAIGETEFLYMCKAVYS